MHVLLDGIHIAKQMKGVGRYVLNTLQEMSLLDTTLKFSVLILSGNTFDGLPQIARTTWIEVPWRNHFWHGFWTLPAWIQRLHPDIVWVPYEGPASLADRPYVMVCHDIPRKIREAQRQRSSNGGWVGNPLCNRIDEMLLTKTLRGASIVFGNSQYVARWLTKHVGVNPSKVSHAPCAPGADFRHLSERVDQDEVRRELKTPAGYVLVFYTGDLRENFSVVPGVYQKIIDGGFPQGLVVAGVQDQSRSFVVSTFSEFPWCSRVRIIPFLEAGKEQKLAEIYAAASVYVDPSLHEGFGMQVIEAMACGTPVVCSNRGALPEVAGDAALLVDPEDSDQIGSAVSKLLANKALGKQLTDRGYDRAAAFSWERTARVIYEGLKRCGENRWR
jgi:glycosyltransferase involved in cell wall biosynthesis